MELMELKVILITLGASFVVSVVTGPILIALLRRMNFGQQIRTDGPQGHLKKQGTPTMGGIIMLLATSIAVLRFAEMNRITLILLIAMLGHGLIGFLDDYIKIWLKRSLGLTAKQKLVGQLIISAVISYLLIVMGHDTTVHIPLTAWNIQIGWFYYPFVAVMLLGTSNAVNFTDGLDGLLAGTSAVAYGAYTIIAMISTSPDAAIFSAAVIGSVLGFLVYNAHPAKVFMGDTGSMALGGGLAALAIVTKAELLLIVIGAVFVIEMLSVIIQVISFKTRGKRVFKMSPIHHHYELSGWSEWKIVIVFWGASILFAGIGLYINEVLK